MLWKDNGQDGNQIIEETVEGMMVACTGRGLELEWVALIILKYLKEYYWKE